MVAPRISSLPFLTWTLTKPQAAGRASFVSPTRSANQGLGRNAADVQAAAAHQVTLDQGDLGAQAGCDQRADQTGRASSHHHQVVAPLGRGVHPVGRMDVGDQFLIVRIAGQYLDLRG